MVCLDGSDRLGVTLTFSKRTVVDLTMAVRKPWTGVGQPPVQDDINLEKVRRIYQRPSGRKSMKHVIGSLYWWAPW